MQRHSAAPAKKSVLNMISLSISVSDWPMICPGGLLLVLPPPVYNRGFSFIGGVAKK